MQAGNGMGPTLTCHLHLSAANVGFMACWTWLHVKYLCSFAIFGFAVSHVWTDSLLAHMMMWETTSLLHRMMSACLRTVILP